MFLLILTLPLVFVMAMSSNATLITSTVARNTTTVTVTVPQSTTTVSGANDSTHEMDNNGPNVATCAINVRTAQRNGHRRCNRSRFQKLRPLCCGHCPSEKKCCSEGTIRECSSLLNRGDSVHFLRYSDLRGGALWEGGNLLLEGCCLPWCVRPAAARTEICNSFVSALLSYGTPPVRRTTMLKIARRLDQRSCILLPRIYCSSFPYPQD